MKPRVALIIETSSRYGRDVLLGIVRYLKTHETWSVFLEQRSLEDSPPQWLNTWQGDGIISRATTPGLLAAVESTGVPLVELTDRHHKNAWPRVLADDQAIGRVGAEHLLERGFPSFAFCGFEGEAWSKRRERAFCEVIESQGYTVDVYESAWKGPSALPWEAGQQDLIGWIESLSKPIGVMTCNDVRGQHLLDACAVINVAVPEELAVIGCDNDDLLCQLCNPPLSSVKPSPERLGYEAAEVLSRLMAGESIEDYEMLIAPLGIATRQSTDVSAIEDSDVASAVRYIRENACNGISVADVLKQVPMSRSALERRFRKYLNRSLQKEIRTVQIKRIRELLAETDLSLERIATLCGFEHPEYMHVVFKREVGQTPGQFRRFAQP